MHAKRHCRKITYRADYLGLNEGHDAKFSCSSLLLMAEVIVVIDDGEKAQL